jgi:hypothetical protein
VRGRQSVGAEPFAGGRPAAVIAIPPYWLAMQVSSLVMVTLMESPLQERSRQKPVR